LPVRSSRRRKTTSRPENADQEDGPRMTSGAWLGACLAVLLFLVGASWLVFTLGRPLWPHQ
jgi:hypothetical protein